MNLRDVPNLDFVRSIAVISVVVEHVLLALGIFQLGPFTTQYLGVLGVLIFFVLTALVLMWSLERKPHTLDFYIRRGFRIYPLVIVAIAAAVLFHAPIAGTPSASFQYQHPHLKDVLVNMCLLQNVVHTDRQVMTVLWSLPYEVQMYIFLPVLFFFVQRNFSVWPLLLFWGFVVLVGRISSPYTSTVETAVGYFLPGIIAYVGFGRWKPRVPGWLLPVFLLAMWAVFLLTFNFHRGWLFCLIVGFALPLFRQLKSEVVLAPSRQIAKYSYGIYLTHPFAIVIGLYLLRGYAWPIRALGVGVPLVVLPVVAYHLVEHPMIRLGSRLAARAEARYEQFELTRHGVRAATQ